MLSPDALGGLSTYTAIPSAYSQRRTGAPNALTTVANLTNNGSAHRASSISVIGETRHAGRQSAHWPFISIVVLSTLKLRSEAFAYSRFSTEVSNSSSIEPQSPQMANIAES
jgi:hypothetical protein